MRWSFFFSVCFFCSIAKLFAQVEKSDTVYNLSEISISSSRLDDFSSGKKNQKIDSNTKFFFNNTSLSELLSKESPIFIKSYGNGSMASSSFRGGNATHTAVIWNGFNLNNVSSGQFDFSLIPVSLSNNIIIQYGGESALWGSGAVGGTVILSSNPDFDKGLNIYGVFSAGSFNDYFQNINVSLSKKKIVTNLKIYNHFSENDYPFFNTYSIDSPRVKQKHAAYKQYGIFNENFLRINNQQEVNLFLWYQQNYYEIAPTMLQENNYSDQNTEILRISSEWKKKKKRIVWMNRAACFRETLLYKDKSIDYSAVTKTNSLIYETESRILLNNRNRINIGMNNTYVNALSDAYSGQQHQNRTAIYASHNYSSKNSKIQNTTSVRQEMIKNSLAPFTFSIGTNYHFAKWLIAKTAVSKIYRIPSFNDLYWNPGGNPKLLPEKGYCEEAGLLAIHNSEKLKFTFEPTVFNRIIENWIIWLPSQSFWSPVNLTKVQSWGMETRSEITAISNKLMTKLSVNTNYVISTNRLPQSINDDSVDKQLIYVPRYTGFVSVSLEYKGLLFYYHHGYTGYRYTSTDNTEYLNPFFIADVFLGKKASFFNTEFSFFIKINNLFNSKYQVISNRAMPLRNYNLGMSIKFIKPNRD